VAIACIFLLVSKSIEDNKTISEYKQCLSFKKHWNSIFSQEEFSENFKALNGLRVLALGAVILGHRTETIASSPLLNPEAMEKVLFDRASEVSD